MKQINWLGSSYTDLMGLSKPVKKAIGYQLSNIQHGLDADDWKPMSSVGRGVKEIRIHMENEYRVFYIAKLSEAIYVLHVFTKKTNKTPQKDIDIAKKRLNELQKKRNDL